MASIKKEQLGKPFFLATSISGGSDYAGWQWEDKLVRLERFDDAREMAQGIYAKDADGRYLVIVHARAGEIEKAVAALKECLEGGDYDPRAIFEDEDAGTILRENDAFKQLREKYYR